jgi:hypothetical protein
MIHTFTFPDELQVVLHGDLPAFFVRQHQRHRIVQIVESWEIFTNWWDYSGAVHRIYHAVITDTGLFCVLFWDVLKDIWYVGKVYD